jgi:hypothetical protein
LRKKSPKIRCLWTQLNFSEGLIVFMEGLIARKIDFEVKKREEMCPLGGGGAAAQ